LQTAKAYSEDRKGRLAPGTKGGSARRITYG
jgi:hypothetical protein